MAKPTMQAVNSSNLESIGYEEEGRTLYVKFHNGKTYKYWPVTPQGFQDFKNAPSVGVYHAKHIKDNPTLNYEQI